MLSHLSGKIRGFDQQRIRFFKKGIWTFDFNSLPSVNGRFNFGIQGKKGISTLKIYTAKRPQKGWGSGDDDDDDDDDGDGGDDDDDEDDEGDYEDDDDDDEEEEEEEDDEDDDGEDDEASQEPLDTEIDGRHAAD